MAKKTASNIKGTSKSVIFSIANFKRLFNQSPARQFLSDMDMIQINEAIEGKNVMLLGKLCDVLLQERATNEQIVRDFVMTKNKIIDRFMIESMEIEKKMVEAPRKKALEKVEKRERSKAEDLLKNL